MRVANNTSDQACSRRILIDFGRHNKYLKYFFQSHVFPHDVSCLPPPQAFPRLREKHGTSEKRESWRQARSAREG